MLLLVKVVAAPRLIPTVLAVPMETEPLAVAPAPPLIVTEPPLRVPDPPVALPPVRIKLPPVTLVVPEPSPPDMVVSAPLLLAPVLVPGFSFRVAPTPPVTVVIMSVV